jgi:Rrf2 family nitric oxide-sensitive transcriptional repressor
MYTAVRKEQLVTTREICRHYKISYHHLTKVVHKLSTCGFIKIKRGQGGGFQLAQVPSEVKLSQVIRAMEPDLHLVECFDRKKNKCILTPVCKIKGELNKALAAFLSSMEQVTIADVIKDHDRF